MGAERIFVDRKYGIVSCLFGNEEGEKKQGEKEFKCLT
jgi:hypothetical protein